MVSIDPDVHKVSKIMSKAWRNQQLADFQAISRDVAIPACRLSGMFARPV